MILVEELLVKALKSKQQSAFKQFVDDFQHMVFNTALSIIHNREEAEDIAQEVFIQAHQAIQQFKGESKLSTWLYRITITKTLDWQRYKQRKKRFAVITGLLGFNNEVETDIPDFVHPGVIMENKERSVILFKAIDRLPDNQKVAFVLNKVEGQNYQEVADIMGVSVGAVESYLHRAKQNLRELLEKYYTDL